MTTSNRRFLRFPLAQRIEHWALVASFTTLAITGLVQKFAELPLSHWLVGVLGGVTIVRIIHRVAATVLMVEAVYHAGEIVYSLFVRRDEPTMLPGKSDLTAAINSFLHNLGLRDERPKQGRFTFEEKAEYWALIWGTVLMAITGFMLWNPIATTKLLPGQFVAAAKAAHGGEALLAVLAIIVWHMYHVHIRRFNKSMFTGYLSEEEMLEEHPLELEQAQATTSDALEEGAAKRRAIFWPAYGVLAVAMLAGIYFFVTFEDTAIATIPPAERARVFAPLTPTPQPAPTDLAVSLTSWDAGVGTLFETKCGFCHGGESPINSLDLTSYDTALLGGETRPAIVPGDPASSELVTRQQQGDHPVELTETELQAIIEWIEAGAPQS